MNRITKLLSMSAAMSGLIFVSSNRLQAEIFEYTSGHADIGLALEAPGQLFLHYHFGVGSAILNGVPATAEQEELLPSQAFVRVSDATIETFPVAVDFLGTLPGESVWILPQSNPPPPHPPVPFLGMASEELDPMQFTSAGFRLTGMSGPEGGNFALWQNGMFGPNVFMRSNDGINPDIDFLPSLVGGHDHYNFGFSKPGIYDIDLLGFATSSGGTLTDSGTFRFVVGSATAIPEPSSFALLIACGFGLVTVRRTRA